MEKILATVGMTENNYSAFVIIGDGIAVATGKTFEKLKKQMRSAVEFHLDGMREDGDDIPQAFNDYELVFKFDPESLLLYYKRIFTNSALKKLTGINDRELQHYASGKTKPQPAQSRQITKALHDLGKELLGVEL
jgi:predicted RNase H-like HicB family nuclease